MNLKDIDQPTLAKKPAPLNGAAVKGKPSLVCHKCHSLYQYRVERNWVLRNVLFFLPIKVFFCARCLKNRYILLTDEEELKYDPV